MLSKMLVLPDIPGLKVTEDDFRSVISYHHSYWRQKATFDQAAFYSVTVDRQTLKRWLNFKLLKRNTRRQRK